MEIIARIFFFGGLLTILYFYGYTVAQTIKLKSRGGLIFLLLFNLLVIALCLFPIFFDIFWILTNGIQFIFVIFLLVHMFATLLFYVRRNRYIVNLKNFKDLPSVSVIIAVFNEEEVIEDTIKNLLKLEYESEKLEIIIIDDNSTDNTLSILKKYENQIRVIQRGPNVIKGKPAALNDLIPTLSSDLVAIFDCDSLPKSDFILRGVKHFQKENVALVQGRNIEYNQNTLVAKLVALDLDVIHYSVYFPKSIIQGMIMFEGRAAILRRDVFPKMGGFDIELPTEDWDYGCRLQLAGYESVYDHSILNYEQAPETVKAYFKQRRRWLSSTVFSMLKSVGYVVKSNSLKPTQKLDYFFTSTYQMWSLTVNFFGFLVFLAYFIDKDLNSFYTMIMFWLVPILLVIPVLLIERKPKHLFYYGFMYAYYWTFTFIIIETVLDHFVLKKTVKYEKTQHFKGNTQLKIPKSIS